jgi:GxxExxY protein
MSYPRGEREYGRFEDPLTEDIIGACTEVHRHMGPGLPESTYELCRAQELRRRGRRAQQQVAVPVAYKGVWLDGGYRLDMVVENRVLLELKAVERLPIWRLPPSPETTAPPYWRYACTNRGPPEPPAASPTPMR